MSFALTPLSAGPLLPIRRGNILRSSFLLLVFPLSSEMSLSQGDLLVSFKLRFFYVLITPCTFSHIKLSTYVLYIYIYIYIIVLNFVHAHTYMYGWPKSSLRSFLTHSFWPKTTHMYMYVFHNPLCSCSFCPINSERAMPNYTITEIPESSRKTGKQMPNK